MSVGYCHTCPHAKLSRSSLDCAITGQPCLTVATCPIGRFAAGRYEKLPDTPRIVVAAPSVAGAGGNRGCGGCGGAKSSIQVVDTIQAVIHPHVGGETA